MVERDFTEIVHTVEEGGTIVSKVGGRFFVAARGVTLGGRVLMNSKGRVHRRGGINNVLHRSIGLLMAGRNTSWERISGSEMMAAIRAGLYFWRRYFVIIILQILILRQYSYSVSASLKLKKDSSTGKKVSGSW